MKLYTEKELRDFIDRHLFIEEFDLDTEIVSPIELPSLEEIWEAGNNEKFNSKHYAFVCGAKWMRDKITEGNK